MKIKYIGNFNDGTGWAKASTFNALCLDAAGHDVYCQEVKYNNANVPLHGRILELLDKKSNSFDYTIQHVLPIQYQKYPNTVNVGFIPVEASISNMLWLKNLNMMDMLFVPDKHSETYLKISGLNKECRIFNHSFDYHAILDYERTSPINGLGDTFNFIFVGEFSSRKDLENLVRAFHSEFEYVEPVNLVIKTSGNQENINGFLTEVRKRIKKPGRLKNEYIILNYLDEASLMNVVKQCHCFVTASHGEAWCYPAAEAMACGLKVIYPTNTGIDTYAELGSNYPIPSRSDACYGATDSVDGLYTCEDVWTTVSNIDIRQQMRKAYLDFVSDTNSYAAKCQGNSEIMKKYDYKNNDLTKGLFE